MKLNVYAQGCDEMHYKPLISPQLGRFNAINATTVTFIHTTRLYLHMLAQYQQAIDQHRRRIYSFARYSLRVKEDAEDVTQEVFIKLWQHWQKVDHSKLGGWLMRVAHNAIIDHVRKQRPAQANLNHYVDVDEQVGAENEEVQLDQDAFKKQLLQVIKALDDPFRSIIIMRDVQGMTYAEIQETLQMSASQVKVYLHRGRRKLRDNSKLRQLFEEQIGGVSRLAKVGNENAPRAVNDKGVNHAK